MSTPAGTWGATPPAIEVLGMTKDFGRLRALDDVSISFAPGSFHAILGENGAGKSTFVKCLMGYYRADSGEIVIGGEKRDITNPRHAHHLGIGMVYQHFTLVPSMTVAENLVLGEEELPPVVDWDALRARIEGFQKTMPFRLDPDRLVSSLSAGEKQKLEILKQFFLGHHMLILDEPTTVLTPAEADEILGMMQDLAADNRLTVVLITHKFREVLGFASEVTVLRSGRKVGAGAVAALSHNDLVHMMVGRDKLPDPATRASIPGKTAVLELRNLTVSNDKGLVAVKDTSLDVHAGEIVGIAGVSGNGQRELVEALAGQRAIESGEIHVDGAPYTRTRREMRRKKVFLLPEEPLRNSCVRSMTVAENLAFRNFDRSESTIGHWLINRAALRRHAGLLIDRYGIKTQGPDARIETLSGGNVQRTVLARELSEDVAVLIAQNPCFGLDIAAVADIRNQIMTARNNGAAILLLSEDLDEMLELADQIVVMFEGEFVYATPREQADVTIIGRHMAMKAQGGPEPATQTDPGIQD